jgi:hypothetical protein
MMLSKPHGAAEDDFSSFFAIAINLAATLNNIKLFKSKGISVQASIKGVHNSMELGGAVISFLWGK